MTRSLLFILILSAGFVSVNAQTITIGNIKVSPKEYKAYMDYLKGHASWESAEDVYGGRPDLYMHIEFYNDLLKSKSIDQRTVHEHNGPNVWEEYLVPDEDPNKYGFMKFHQEYIKKQKHKP